MVERDNSQDIGGETTPRGYFMFYKEAGTWETGRDAIGSVLSESSERQRQGGGYKTDTP